MVVDFDFEFVVVVEVVEVVVGFVVVDFVDFVEIVQVATCEMVSLTLTAVRYASVRLTTRSWLLGVENALCEVVKVSESVNDDDDVLANESANDDDVLASESVIDDDGVASGSDADSMAKASDDGNAAIWSGDARNDVANESANESEHGVVRPNVTDRDDDDHDHATSSETDDGLVRRRDQCVMTV